MASSKAMAFRMSRYTLGETLTVYWFSSETEVTRAWGWSVDSRLIALTATDSEAAGWSAAATAYVDEVAAATAEFSPVEQRFYRGRRWQRRRYEKAKAGYLSRIRTAAAAYSSVREAVEERLAEAEAVRRDEAREAYEAQERRLAEARSRFAAWEMRQAVADRRLPGGLTPRELADRGEDPPAWPRAVRDAVGDVEAWWAGVIASARNEEALTVGVQEVVSAIASIAAALEADGRPGITVVKDKPHEVLHGWWIDFDWSDLPSTKPLRIPPDMPVAHLWAGDWNYDLYLPNRRLLTPSNSGKYRLATVTSEDIANGLARRHKWWIRDIEEFAENLFPTWITYRERYAVYNKEVRIRLPHHADPAVYIPYVQAVAEHAAAAFTVLVPGQD